MLSISELNTWNSLGSLYGFILDSGLKVILFNDVGSYTVATYRIIHGRGPICNGTNQTNAGYAYFFKYNTGDHIDYDIVTSKEFELTNMYTCTHKYCSRIYAQGTTPELTPKKAPGNKSKKSFKFGFKDLNN